MTIFPNPKWLAILALAVPCLLGCEQKSELSRAPAPPKESSNAGMILIPKGEFVMGSDSGRQDEMPAHKVSLDSFYIDETEVTNAQFAKFVEASQYKTEAEIPPDPKDFPGVPKEKLVPGALVFTTGKGWAYVPGANWRHPQGPDSSIENKMNHPVVQVSWNDATAYAKWAGKELPTEAQFEFAARGNQPNAEYSWGTAEPNDAKPQANYWQGDFPTKNNNTDGFPLTSPVRSFAKNPFGLYDMGGNVWEWCKDWYRPDAYKDSTKTNPTGPKDSLDPDEPGVSKRVVKGGSFLCADCYCRGYRITARMKSSPDTGLMHTGFRCVINLSNSH